MDSRRKLIIQVKREMIFHVDYLSCLHCACNYSCIHEMNGLHKPVFCQVFSKNIDPKDMGGNQEQARNCPNWVPRGADRSKIITPDVERWYEKDSMG